MVDGEPRRARGWTHKAVPAEAKWGAGPTWRQEVCGSVAPGDVGTGDGLVGPSGGDVYELGLVRESGAVGVRVGIAGELRDR